MEPLASTIRNCNGPEEEWGIRINGTVMICSSVHGMVKSDNFLVIPKRPLVIINWPRCQFAAPCQTIFYSYSSPSRSLQRAKICLDRLSLVKLG